MGKDTRIRQLKSSWIDETFPKLAESGYEITSEPTDSYNCIAYAAGDESNWWSYSSGFTWPGAIRSPFVEDLVDVFRSLGFEVCATPLQEVGFHKVALYSKGRIWKHAAKQLPGGAWSSKLGPDEDIRHESLEALVGEFYGEVYCIMRRSDNHG